MERRKKNQLNIIELLILILAVISITPILSARIPTIISAVIFGLLMVLIMWHEKGRIAFAHSQSTMIISASLFVILILFYKIIGYSSAQIGNSFQQILFFSGIFEAAYISKNCTVENKKKLFWAIWIVSVFNILDNIRLGIIYPNASVYAANLDLFPYLRNTNVGSTVFNTYVLIFYDINMLLFLTIKERKKKCLFGIASLASFVFLTFYGLRASIVVLMALSTVALIITRDSQKNSRKGLISAIVLLLIGLFIIVFYDKLLAVITSLLPDSRLSTRLAELAKFSLQDLGEDSFSGRFALVKESIQTFTSSIRSFLFGIGDHRSAGGYSGFISSGIGGHSELIDALARFGLLGFSLIILPFSSYRKHLEYTFTGKRCYQQILIIYYVVITCMLVKSYFFPSVGVVTFILLPMTYSIINEEN